MRPLRLLHRDLSDLPAPRRRARRAARPDLPDQAGARRRRGHGEDAAAPRSLPHLPQLRDELPVGRAVRPSRRHRPQARRGEGRPDGRGAREAARGRDALSDDRRVRPGDHASAGFARPLLPASLRDKLPATVPSAGRWPAPRHARKMVALAGCVQPVLTPDTNAAAARVLDRLGISLVEAPRRRLLRRGALPPGLPGRRPRRHAPRDRRLVAARGAAAWRRS